MEIAPNTLWFMNELIGTVQGQCYGSVCGRAAFDRLELVGMHP